MTIRLFQRLLCRRFARGSGLDTDEFIKIAGRRQLDDHVFAVLGFARDAIVARIFGAGMATTPFSSLLNFLTCCAVSLPKGIFPGICTDSGRI